MAARLLIPRLPHHITQRGNRRQETFLNDGDYAAYLELMAEWCGEEGVEIWKELKGRIYWAEWEAVSGLGSRLEPGEFAEIAQYMRLPPLSLLLANS